MKLLMENKLNGIIKLTIYLFLISFFVGCENDTSIDDPCDEITCPNNSICINGSCECPTGYSGDSCDERLYFLKNIRKNNSVYQVFEYDNNNRLSKINQSETNDHPYVFNFTYSSDSVNVEITNQVSFVTVNYLFIVNANDLQLDFIYTDSSSQGETRMKYSNQDVDCGYLMGELYNSSGNVKSYFEYDYSGNCKVVKKTFSAEDDSLLSITLITMDESEFIHQSENLIGLDPNYAFIINKKNIREKHISSFDHELNDSQSYESSFVLNADNFPVKETRTYLNGIVEEFSFEYY